MSVLSEEKLEDKIWFSIHVMLCISIAICAVIYKHQTHNMEILVISILHLFQIPFIIIAGILWVLIPSIRTNENAHTVLFVSTNATANIINIVILLIYYIDCRNIMALSITIQSLIQLYLLRFAQ